MDRLKEFFLKNNYLALKITGAVLTAGVAITAVTLIVTGDKGTEISTNDKGSSAIETTVDVAQNVSTEDGSTENQVSNDTQDVTSSEEETTTFDGELTSDEESISTKELALGNDNTTTTQNNGATESKTQEQTTSKVVTTQKPSTSKQQVTSSQAQTTTTQAQTTTQKPTTTTTPIETTTQEETTTAPPRGANGVILEELTIQWLNKDPYTIPATWKQFCDDKGRNYDDEFISGVDYESVLTEVAQDALGNGILLYKDGFGSTIADVINIYGEPKYRYTVEMYGIKAEILLYKYLDIDDNDEQNMYIRFEAASNMNNRIISIMAGKLVNFTDEYFNPYE